jgi:hypothetical protein
MAFQTEENMGQTEEMSIECLSENLKEREKPFWRRKRRWQNNIEMDVAVCAGYRRLRKGSTERLLWVSNEHKEKDIS